MDDRLSDVRALTGGPFTSTMARQAGFLGTEMRRLLRGGAWVVLRRGVYVEASVVAEAAVNQQRQHALEVAGVILCLRADAVAGGPSAARIWGLDTLASPSAEVVVITDDDTVPIRRRDGYTVRMAALPSHHRRVRHGVGLTCAARTAIDLARTTTFTDGVVVVESALRTGRASQRQLEEMLCDCHRWPGIAQARRIVEFANPRSDSALESVSRVAMLQQGLPAPRTQVTIGNGRDFYARVDFLWDEVGVIGEADGLAKYQPDGKQTTRQIVRAEKRREERLADAGYEIVRWGWEDANDPPRLAQRLRAAFGRGAERRRGREAG